MLKYEMEEVGNFGKIDKEENDFKPSTKGMAPDSS